jgi:hypothetical protein
MHTVNLGDKVKDRVSGLTGIAVARTQWLNGCVRIAIQPSTLDKDGKVQEATYVDEPQIDILKAGAIKVEIGTPEPVRTERNKTGGPLDLPRDARGVRDKR